MINCPNCGGLNPATSQICGACGASLAGVNNQPQPTNNETKISSPGLFLYDQEEFQSPIKTEDVKNAQPGISIWHILLFIASICSWIFIPIRIVKLLIAFVFFYIAESSNRKNSIFLILVRIITALQIIGFVIALVLRTFVSADMMYEYFKYFKF